jgi:hypothetical protein
MVGLRVRGPHFAAVEPEGGVLQPRRMVGLRVRGLHLAAVE